MEDRVSLDISEALSAIENIDAAFGKTLTDFQTGIEQAIGSISTSIDITANVDDVTSTVDDALAAADTALPVSADVDALTAEIDDALANVDNAPLTIAADVSEAQAAIDGLSDETVTVGVEADTSQAEQSLSDLTGQAHEAGGAAHEGAGEFALLGLAAKGAAGELGAGTEALHLFGAGGVAAASGIGALAVITKELFGNAVDARSAEEQFNLILGDQAEVVNRIDIGGLNDSLDELSVKLGSTGKETEEAASKIFSLGTTSGKAAPAVAETTKEVIALAARAVALRPQLGNVGDVAERLFTGLARGGRFAANFNIALTSAEINARALADTGKAAASELTVYEKSAAGAALATEKLGDSLGTSVEEGSKNVAFSLSSLKARFEEFLEAAGQPLVDPLIQSLQDLLPVAESLAGVFAQLLPPLIEIANSVLEVLGPAFDLITPTISAVAEGLHLIADVLNIIPGPVRTAAVAFGLLAVALNSLATSSVVGSLAGFSGLSRVIAGLPGAVVPATAAIIGVTAVVNKAKGEIKRADDETQAYTDSLINMLQTAPDIESFEAGLGHVADEANRFGDAANKANRNPFRAFDGHDTRLANDAAVATRSVLAAGEDLVPVMKDLRDNYGLTSQAAASLVLQGEEAVASFKAQAEAAKGQSEAMSVAKRATDDFWLAAQTGALSVADIENQAAALNVTFDDLSKAVDEARKPVAEFAANVEASLPGVTKALNDLGENQGLNQFVKNLEKNVADSAAFVGNLQTLIDRGATDLAKLLEQTSTTDPGKAAALAAEAVKKSQAALDSVEGKIDASNFGRSLVNKATENVTNELSGGLELAFNKAQETIGAAMLKIPGQVEPQGKETGRDIATNLIAEILTPFQHLADDMEKAGEDAIAGFETGVSKGDAASIAGAKAKAVIDNVKHVLGIASPSKVFQEIGELVAAGFFAGLQDLEGTADAIDPILDVVNKFKLSANDVKNAVGNNVDEITKSLQRLGEETEKITPDKLLAIGDAVKALGGSKGVKDLQNALAQQVSAAFGGLGAKEITQISEQLRLAAVVNRAQGSFGVTPVVPKPFETQVVKGPDIGQQPIIQQDITVTPPPDATASEMAGAIGTASAWAFAGVTG